MSWQTRFTKNFPCTLPLFGAPMAGVSGGILASATTKTDALGSIAAGHYCNEEAVKNLEVEIENFYRQSESSKDKTPPPLVVGFICHSTFATPNGWNLVEDFMKKYKPAAVQYFAPALVPKPPTSTQTSNDILNNNIDLAHKYGIKVLTQVGTQKEAQQVLNASTDCIIVQGTEAGGHGCRPDIGSGTLALASNIISMVRSDTEKKDTPVLAAGGIVNGRGVAAALALGCDGVVLGTRLWASMEAKGVLRKKEQLTRLDIGPDEIVRTTVMDQIQNTFMETPWPKPFDNSGLVRNEMIQEWHGREHDLHDALLKSKKRKKIEKGNDNKEQEENAVVTQFKAANNSDENDDDPSKSFIYAGKGVGEISSIQSVNDIIKEIEEEARRTIRTLPQILPDKSS